MSIQTRAGIPAIRLSLRALVAWQHGRKPRFTTLRRPKSKRAWEGREGDAQPEIKASLGQRGDRRQ